MRLFCSRAWASLVWLEDCWRGEGDLDGFGFCEGVVLLSRWSMFFTWRIGSFSAPLVAFS